MSGALILLNLAGAVALLIWATRMVRTGVERAFGAGLRRGARRTMGSAPPAAALGMLMAIAMQSSTAVALLVSGFAASAVITPMASLGAMLGADLGSAVVVKLLSFDLSVLVPICLVSGTLAFLSSAGRTWRQMGRIAVGLGLVLLSLRLIGEASLPLKTGGLSGVLVGYLVDDPIIAFALAAGFAWLVHSSVATVLVIVSLAAQGLLPVPLAMVLILGANLGGALIPLVLTRSASELARAAPIGNFLLRGLGAITTMLLLSHVQRVVPLLGASEATALIHFHVLFNAIVLVTGLVLLVPVSRLSGAIAARLMPAAEVEPLERAVGSALVPEALATPRLALAAAAREVLLMGELVETMLRRIIELYESADKAAVIQLRDHDDLVDQAHASLKLYLAQVAALPLNEDDATRAQELIAASVRIEQVGDIIVRSMLSQVNRKLSRQVEFSEDGWREITQIHAQVLQTAQLAFNVLISRDRETAIELVQENDRMRSMEHRSARMHFERLGEGTASSIETSSIHLDTVRDLRQINSLLASIAYPILEEHGLLLASRLSSPRMKSETSNSEASNGESPANDTAANREAC